MSDTKRIEAKLDKIANSIDRLTRELEKHRIDKQSIVNIKLEEGKADVIPATLTIGSVDATLLRCHPAT